MEKQLEQIREKQKEPWNKFSPSHQDDLLMDFLKPLSDEIIQILNPKNTNVVLDVTSGTGEPASTIASKLKTGKVIAVEGSEGMLAREDEYRNEIHNVEVHSCDVGALPFASNSFDAISCHLGFMFFRDMNMAAKEMLRVLKRGGKIATSVWNIPEKNFWFTAMAEAINQHMGSSVASTSAQGMFSCAADNFLSDLLWNAGFQYISVKEVKGQLPCYTPEEYWNVMTTKVAPITAALDLADDAMKQTIKSTVFKTINQKHPDGNIMIDSSALVISGKK